MDVSTFGKIICKIIQGNLERREEYIYCLVYESRFYLKCILSWKHTFHIDTPENYFVLKIGRSHDNEERTKQWSKSCSDQFDDDFSTKVKFRLMESLIHKVFEAHFYDKMTCACASSPSSLP